MFEDIFYRKKLDIDRLTPFGFAAKEGRWVYDTVILDGAFTLQVSVLENGNVDTELTETATGELYILYKTDASGTFVGEVRAAIEAVLRKVAEECFVSAVFQSEQTLEIIDCVRNTYGDEPEFLWEKSPDNAVWRRKDSGKWYGIIMTIPKRKLGLPSDEAAEILDLRLEQEKMPQTVDHERFFPGWHMNKKSWYTIILDHSVPTEEICSRIDASYRLAKK